LYPLKCRHVFAAEHKLSTLVSLLVMELYDQHMTTFQLLEIVLYQKLKNKLNIMSSFVLTMVSLFTSSRIVQRH